MRDWSAHVIFCDDIRQEMNSKFILVGVYTGEMILFVSPSNVSLGTFVEVEGLPLGNAQILLKVRFEDGRNTVGIGETMIAIDVTKDDQPVVLAPTGLPFYTDRDGLLIVSVAINGHDPRDVGRLKISHPNQRGVSGVEPNGSESEEKPAK